MEKVHINFINISLVHEIILNNGLSCTHDTSVMAIDERMAAETSGIAVINGGKHLSAGRELHFFPRRWNTKEEFPGPGVRQCGDLP